MPTAVLDRGSKVHKESSTEPATTFHASDNLVPSSIEAAIERIVAAAPPLSRAQRDQLATILGGGA